MTSPILDSRGQPASFAPTEEEVTAYLQRVPDDVLQGMSFQMVSSAASPWQMDPDTGSRRDPDLEDGDYYDLEASGGFDVRQRAQRECWRRVHANPQINTAVRGKTGRLTGWGFTTSSIIPWIQDTIEEIELDPRNRLWHFWPKYVSRVLVEGELFLIFTVHSDGFIEVDFVAPDKIGIGGTRASGITYHPSKTQMPLLFHVIGEDGAVEEQIPSINIAYFPELLRVARTTDDSFKVKLQKSRTRAKAYKSVGGFNKFGIYWDKSFITYRAHSYLRTTLEWINHYDNLKKYEIDHKKSAGSYLWVFKITDPRTFKLWLTLSEADRKKTGIMAKKTPGSSLVLPPGMEVEVLNPQLTSIKEQDTDIMEMITSGLDEAADVTTGTAKGTFASIKATRGPMTDRTSDDMAYFQRFLLYDFWKPIFFLRNKVAKKPYKVKVRKAREFRNKKPVMKEVMVLPETQVEISFPVSETIDYEGRAKGLLGSKHGPVSETLQISRKEIATRMGFGNYGKLLLDKATEDELYPDPVYADPESLQETTEGNLGEGKAPKKAPAPQKKKGSNDASGT